jgi:hypothetical protein
LSGALKTQVAASISPLAGKPAPPEMLIDPVRLERDYFERRPDPSDPEQMVKFEPVATAVHRSAAASTKLTFWPSRKRSATTARLTARLTARMGRSIWVRIRMRSPRRRSERRSKSWLPMEWRPSSSGTMPSLQLQSSRAPSWSTIAAVRRGGRDRVGCIILGRGEDDRKVHEWLTTAAAVPGFIGFAVGRTSFWDPLVAWRAKQITREQAVNDIVRRYREFVDTFEGKR